MDNLPLKVGGTLQPRLFCKADTPEFLNFSDLSSMDIGCIIPLDSHVLFPNLGLAGDGFLVCSAIVLRCILWVVIIVRRMLGTVGLFNTAS